MLPPDEKSILPHDFSKNDVILLADLENVIRIVDVSTHRCRNYQRLFFAPMLTTFSRRVAIFR